MGFNRSYAWRRIWGSRSVLEMGFRWRIEDGKSARLWKDAWVGRDGFGKLISLRRILDENTTVDVILDNDNRTWRADVMNAILLPIDVE